MTASAKADMATNAKNLRPAGRRRHFDGLRKWKTQNGHHSLLIGAPTELWTAGNALLSRKAKMAAATKATPAKTREEVNIIICQ
jgi:hypothetical protein